MLQEAFIHRCCGTNCLFCALNNIPATFPKPSFQSQQQQRLTFAAEEILPGAPAPVVADERLGGAVRGVDAVPEAADALLPQQPHEELQADEGEHAQAEDGQDHDVGQLPHRLDQSAHDGFQTFAEEERT